MNYRQILFIIEEEKREKSETRVLKAFRVSVDDLFPGTKNQSHHCKRDNPVAAIDENVFP